ncbi:MAG TPA: DUF2846 domain-containing protein [Sphingopyxis sp.]|uniref:DUF2846 domain-containing protein n=1 Tax=Sphingopyxis sp. TaxID=1908224 RepID=UPI002B50EB11|nr:DUF2846 domain-containing protein [Sphingopyxis sp.]HWW57454.1 DUF2846 domain-containing protein [Sphingopyxis sp.]
MSKNAMWLTLIFVAAIFGAMMGPTLARTMSPGTLLILTVILFGGIIAFCMWALSSNKGGAKADTAAIADARVMRAPEGKARIYVTRRGFVAALQGMDVTLDGSAKGQIKSGQMLMADVAPGVHHIHVSTAKAKLARPAELEIEVGAGGVVVIDAMIEMGALKGGVKLTRSDAAKARDDVHATKLILWEVAPA